MEFKEATDYLIEKKSSRRYADSLTRILFQYQMRKNPVTFEQLESHLGKIEENSAHFEMIETEKMHS